MPTGPRLRLLIAEDDPASLRLYATYAERRGHQVLTAEDGAATLLLAATEHPDAVLLDVSMPKLDGRDVLRQLKANPHTAGIPVLVVSAAGADQSIRGQLFELGAEEVLAKPIDLSATFAMVERLAARDRAPAGT
jgi:CheY-like chemotaxis protein